MSVELNIIFIIRLDIVLFKMMSFQIPIFFGWPSKGFHSLGVALYCSDHVNNYTHFYLKTVYWLAAFEVYKDVQIIPIAKIYLVNSLTEFNL